MDRRAAADRQRHWAHPWPRPERFYFHFGRPIDTHKYKGADNDKAACWELRETVRHAVEAGIRFLLAKREHDPGRDLLPRLLGRGSVYPSRKATRKRTKGEPD